MSLGLNPQKTEVDSWAGNIGRDLAQAFRRIETFKYWLDAQLDADLTTLGYTAGEIATLRSAFSDMDQLRTLYLGAATLGVAKDFRTFLRRIFGLGAL